MEVGVVSKAISLVDPFAEDAQGLWFLLRARARQEKAVANDLITRGVTHYLPLLRCKRYYGNRKAEVELPMFPGYVFLRGAASDAFATDRAGRLAQIIPVVNQQRLHDELKNIALALGTNANLSYFPYLNKGVHVEVRSGPFRGLRGMIEDWTKRDRLILQVEILGRGVSLELDAALLDVID
jgi:transcription antitermination factor NusG